jgi:signal transduction histidine kinase
MSDQQRSIKDMRRQWRMQFNVAFALMSVIPLLICCYLLTVKFFSVWILVGLGGVYFFFAVMMAVLGLLAGRQTLERLIRQLLHVNEQLERVNIQQGEFVTQVAHEFRSPLAIVKGALDNLKDGLYGPLALEQAEAIAISHQEVGRLKRLVGDLLDLGQIESGTLRLLPRDIVLQEVLRTVTQSCTGLAKSRGLHLELELPGPPMTLRADPDRLSQVFLNLVTNAIKFTDHGQVGLRMSQSEQAVVVEVADSGRGMAAEDLEKIFKKFERVGEKDREGSGLGLPIAKAIVELHGGRLTVESQPGRGSRFFVHLPRRTEPSS